MIKKKLLLILMTFSMLLTCTACNSKNVQLAVTIYPIQYLIERIGGNYISVSNISEEVAIQSAQVKTNYDDILEESKALFYITELEPYFDVYSDTIRSDELTMVNLASKSVFYEFQRYTTTTVDGKTAVVEGPYYEGDIFKNVDVYKQDPMIWMDPVSMISAAEIVRDYLVENYPEYRVNFIENYEALEMDLSRLDMEYQNMKNSTNNISFVCMTPSFGPWQKSYAISIYPICLSKYGALPSSEQLEVMKQKIKDDGVRYIVREPNLNKEMNALFDSLKSELELVEIELSNLSSLSTTQKKENKDYLTIMYENLEVLESIGNGEI